MLSVTQKKTSLKKKPDLFSDFLSSGFKTQTSQQCLFFKRITLLFLCVVRMFSFVWVTKVWITARQLKLVKHKSYCCFCVWPVLSSVNVFLFMSSICRSILFHSHHIIFTSWALPPAPWLWRPPCSWTASQPPAPPAAPPAPPTARPLWQWGRFSQCWEHFCRAKSRESRRVRHQNFLHENYQCSFKHHTDAHTHLSLFLTWSLGAVCSLSAGSPPLCPSLKQSHLHLLLYRHYTQHPLINKPIDW